MPSVILVTKLGYRVRFRVKIWIEKILLLKMVMVAQWLV